MKTLHKVVLSLVALGALAFATPAQARWFHHRVFIGAYPYYYGPAYYGYYNPYYGPYYGGGFTFSFGGHRYWHARHWR